MRKFSSGTKIFIALTIFHAVVFNVLFFNILAESKYLLFGITAGLYTFLSYFTGRFILWENKREVNKGYFLILFHTIVFFIHNTVALIIFRYYALYILIPWITIFSLHFIIFLIPSRKEKFSISSKHAIQKA